MDGIGERIRCLREARELSMNELEDLLGASRGSVNKWEKGSIPGGRYLVLLSDFFSVSTDWILRGEEYLPKAAKGMPAGASTEDLKLFDKFLLLTERQKGRIEGHVDEMLEGMTEGSTGRISSSSHNGNQSKECTPRPGHIDF